jgi:hypothetical protein
MRRREMVSLMFLAGAAASVGATSEAGQPAPPIRVGVLLPVPGNDPFLALLRDGLRGVGWTDDGALVLEVRQADGTVAAFQRLGSELAALPVDVLVTASTAAAKALAEVTRPFRSFSSARSILSRLASLPAWSTRAAT